MISVNKCLTPFLSHHAPVQPAPDFEIEFLDGSEKNVSAVIAEGKPVVIDFYCNF